MTTTAFMVIVAFVMAGLAAVGISSPAHAASCYGDYCSGQSPTTTTARDGRLCLDGSYAVATTSPVYADSRYKLDIMWSPRCKTNFARWRGPNAPYVLRTEQDSGYQQSRIIQASATVWYSPMIYSPVRACRAFGYIRSAGSGSHSYTAWV